MYVPYRAAIPLKVGIVTSRKCFVRLITPQDVRFIPTTRNVKDTDVVFVVDNLFKGPFELLPIKGNSSRGFSADILIENAFPTSQVKRNAKCSIPDWALNELIFGGYVKKDGYISSEVEMCAITYGVAHSTLILKDGEIYKQILK